MKCQILIWTCVHVFSMYYCVNALCLIIYCLRYVTKLKCRYWNTHGYRNPCMHCLLYYQYFLIKWNISINVDTSLPSRLHSLQFFFPGSGVHFMGLNNTQRRMLPNTIVCCTYSLLCLASHLFSLLQKSVWLKLYTILYCFRLHSCT